MNYLSHEEIHMQSQSLLRTQAHIISKSADIKRLFENTKDVVFVAAGSSYWLSLSAHKTMNMFTQRRCYAVKAADVYMCPDEYNDLYDAPVFVVPSRSGLSKEVLEALRILKVKYPDSKVISVIEYKENKLEELSDLALYIEWANETSVCQTRSFSNLYVASVTIAAILGERDSFNENMKQYLTKSPELLVSLEKKIIEIADVDKVNGVVSLASGLQYGVAIEGAYIVIEMAEYAANYYQLLEYRHGPVVTSHKGVCAFVCSSGDENAALESGMCKEIRKTGATVFAVANHDVSWADYTFSLGGDYCKEAVALHFVQVMQSFAHHFSIARGKNPDSPGDLVPFITY